MTGKLILIKSASSCGFHPFCLPANCVIPLIEKFFLHFVFTLLFLEFYSRNNCFGKVKLCLLNKRKEKKVRTYCGIFFSFWSNVLRYSCVLETDEKGDRVPPRLESRTRLS